MIQSKLKPETVEKIKRWGIISLPLLALAFIFRTVFLGPNIFSHLDLLTNYLPYLYSDANLKTFIQPAILSGFPPLVSITTWFNPINSLLFHFFDPFDAFRYLDLAYLAGVYIFTYLLARRLNLSVYGAALAGVIYLLAGQVMLWSETIFISSYYLLLPLVLYLFERAGAEIKSVKRLSWLLLSGVALGLGWLAGHFQFAIYVHSLVTIYFLFINWSKWRTRFWEGFFFLIPSALIGYIQISSTLAFEPATIRLAGIGLDSVWGLNYYPYHLLHYLLPSLKIPYLSLPQAFPNYLSLPALALLVFFLFHFRHYRLPSRIRFFAWTAAFCFVSSVAYSPLAAALHYLPLFNSFREASRIMFLGDLALGILIAYLIEDLWSRRDELASQLNWYLAWLRRLGLFLVLPLVALATVLKIFWWDALYRLALNYFLAHRFKQTTGGYPLAHYQDLIKTYLHQGLDQFSFFDWRILALLIFTTLTYWWLRQIKILGRECWLGIAVLLVSLNFAVIYADRINGLSRTDILTPPKTAQFILDREKNSPLPFRIFSVFNETAIWDESVKCQFPDLGNWNVSRPDFFLRKELIEPNMNIYYGLESADGYEPYESVRMSALVGYLGSRQSVTKTSTLALGNQPMSEKIKRVSERKNLYRAANIKYLLSYYQLSDPDLKQVFASSVGTCGSQVYIYELNRVWPRYFLTNQVVQVVVGTPFVTYMQTLESLATPAVVLEATTSSPVSFGQSQAESPTGSADHLSFALNNETESPEYLFIGQAFIPGWTATLDGMPIKIEVANYAYSSVLVPPGRHEVKLDYSLRNLQKLLFRR